MKEISLLERFLLLFKKPYWLVDSCDNICVKLKCKNMFGNVYVLKEEVIKNE